MAKLSSEQKQNVNQWAGEGASLNDIQSRLKSECGITLTYLEARMLLIDLGVNLQEKPKPVEAAPVTLVPQTSPDTGNETGPAPGGVSVRADAEPLSGTMASGSVVFSDGKSAVWFVDQMGRLGLKAPEPGYQPPAADIPLFEGQLDALLSGL